MTWWVDVKQRSAERDHRRRRDAEPGLWVPETLADWHARWNAAWPAALERNPVEPRLKCIWQLLDAIELWAVGKGWYRSGFGPNGHENGFNVFFRELGNLSIPGTGLAWSTDELNGAEDDL